MTLLKLTQGTQLQCQTNQIPRLIYHIGNDYNTINLWNLWNFVCKLNRIIWIMNIFTLVSTPSTHSTCDGIMFFFFWCVKWNEWRMNIALLSLWIYAIIIFKINLTIPNHTMPCSCLFIWPFAEHVSKYKCGGGRSTFSSFSLSVRWIRRMYHKP